MGNEIVHMSDDGELVFKINRKSKRGEYHILESKTQKHIVIDPIKLEGFDALPSGFYKDGYGLTAAGNFVLQEINSRFKKKIELTVTAQGPGKIDARGKSIKVILPQPALAQLGQTFRTIKRERNEEMRLEVKHFLGQQFKQFKDLKDVEAGYTPGRLAEVLAHDKIVSKLSVDELAPVSPDT